LERHSSDPRNGLVIETASLAPKAGATPRVVDPASFPVAGQLGGSVGPVTVTKVAPAAPAASPGSRRSRWLRRYVRWLVVGDAFVALLSSLVAYLVRFGPTPTVGHSPLYVVVSVALPLAWVGVLALGRCYEHRFLGEGSAEYRRIVDSAVRLLALLAVVAFLVHWDFARGYAVIALPLMVAGSLLVHLGGRTALHRAEQSGAARQRVVVIGTERAIAEMVRRLDTSENLGRADDGFEIVGALVDTSRSDVIEGVPVVGTSRDAGTVATDMAVDAIAVAAWSTFSQLELRRLAWELEGTDVEVLVAPNLTDVAGPRLSIRPVAGLPLLHVDKPEFTGFRRVAKGLFDRGVALAALILLSPVLLAIAVAVRLDSRGPAFFRQQRVGKGGREFSMVKFRSMHVDAEHVIADLRDKNVHDKGPLFKIHDDPRITRVGRVLRRASIDELPQLWNVVRGQMSLVGPRPPLPSEVEQYAHDVYRRLLVKPGITGLWQVSGRSDLTWDESVRLDLYYVENWNLYMDVSILFRTVRAVVAARGAY
jgi:exopolysaccharide biosynthesis polyprenyl glycosylphosphotransferase